MPTVRQRIRAGNEYVFGKIYALESATVNALFEGYRIALQDMLAALRAAFDRVGTDTWSPANVAARQALINQIMAAMMALDAENAPYIVAQMLDAYRAGYYGTAWMLDSSLLSETGNPLTMPLLPTEAIRAQLLAPYVGVTFVERFQYKRVDFERRIKTSLAQSQIRGEGVRQAQNRIADALGIDISRRTAAARQAHRRDFYRTQLIARTELLRASNLGAQTIYRANRDVLSGWEYLTAKDERVCPRCGPLDGRRFDLDTNEPIDGKGPTAELLPPPIHPQCRCTSLPVLADQDLERRIVGERETFTEWAARRGLTENVYGQAFDLRGQQPPTLRRAS